MAVIPNEDDESSYCVLVLLLRSPVEDEVGLSTVGFEGVGGKVVPQTDSYEVAGASVVVSEDNTLDGGGEPPSVGVCDIDGVELGRILMEGDDDGQIKSGSIVGEVDTVGGFVVVGLTDDEGDIEEDDEGTIDGLAVATIGD